MDAFKVCGKSYPTLEATQGILASIVILLLGDSYTREGDHCTFGSEMQSCYILLSKQLTASLSLSLSTSVSSVVQQGECIRASPLFPALLILHNLKHYNLKDINLKQTKEATTQAAIYLHTAGLTIKEIHTDRFIANARIKIQYFSAGGGNGVHQKGLKSHSPKLQCCGGTKEHTPSKVIWEDVEGSFKDNRPFQKAICDSYHTKRK